VGVHGLDGIGLSIQGEVRLAPAEARWVTVAVQVPPDTAQRVGAGAHVIHFDVGLLESDGRGGDVAAAALSEKSTFVVPR
jgi:IG-like fold at C-terminal of FixG, putative oxidoreductase